MSSVFVYAHWKYSNNYPVIQLFKHEEDALNFAIKQISTYVKADGSSYGNTKPKNTWIWDIAQGQADNQPAIIFDNIEMVGATKKKNVAAPTSDKAPKELADIELHLDVCRKARTLDKKRELVKKLISMYEDYMLHVVCQPSAYHKVEIIKRLSKQKSDENAVF